MRRGLLNWSKEELPEAVFDARVQRLREAMHERGLDAVLVYTNFPRPAGVAHLTHFVPYWNQCVLAVLPVGLPSLIVSLSKRVAGWIMETSHVHEVICSPNIGGELCRLLEGAAARRIGMVELDKTPRPIISALLEADAGYQITDATGLFASVRNPADEAEIMLSRKAAEMAADALAGAVEGDGDPDLAAIERDIRYAGAEDVFMDIAPDLTRDPNYIRADRPMRLGARYAIRLSVAYNGTWIRYGRSFERDGNSDAVAAISDYLAAAIPALGDGADLKPLAAHADALSPLQWDGVIIEGCTGCAPLQLLPNPPAGAVVSLGFTFRDERGHWLVDEPAVLSTGGANPAARLTRS
ncbi:MAG: aminopeptidase P family N-terminal domain-containing protein [Rhodospirillales bacterium]|jgi:hypothetical protein|nr:hypothetical protein [Rhodospirillaceae bacterium]MDP6427178.1 aminopeptidase P family N-terminal domain-containing protein [Rhodospirillales bacterium]MDP6646572.1 aminopeptidase P family N-terminal domain-containing protein [Rhodospirillales bacterium]MDP6840956.1 aminopeptidase P family N-terminal domain-containing protein [Rhodospirillales bacterium]